MSPGNVGAGLRACPFKIHPLNSKMRIAVNPPRFFSATKAHNRTQRKVGLDGLGTGQFFIKNVQQGKKYCIISNFSGVYSIIIRGIIKYLYVRIPSN
jgi:hypothetical protein